MENSNAILITGTSRGIGKEIFNQLKAQKKNVIGGCRNPKDPDEIELDVSSTGQIEKLCNYLKDNNITLDVLINNAAIYSDRHTPADVIKTNYFAPRNLIENLRPFFAPAAKIINISSSMGALNGFSSEARKKLLDTNLTIESLDQMVREYVAGKNIGWPTNSYSVSKGALNTLTRILHRQLSPEGFTIISICPGWVRTDMGGKGAPRAVEQGAETPVWAATTANLESGYFYRDKEKIEW